ncbi:hypothetical protein [Corynebacterium sp. A21]|uniref:hypothetical protein n=1 Tax=Corynebacterium sp. A21 TaxID=3457318 RepID=UPI003FD15074
MATNPRLTNAEDQQLSYLATSAGLSKQQVITQLIRKQWETENARVTASRQLDDIFTQRKPLMDRLRDA